VSEPLDPLVKAHRKIAQLTQINSELRAINKKALRRGAGYDTFIEELGDVIAKEQKNPFKVSPTTLPSLKSVEAAEFIGKDHAEIACHTVSDWHLAEVIRLEETNGINKYNSIIASNRAYATVQKVKRLIRIHQAVYSIKELWVPVLGDMIHGSIHPEFITTNDLSDAASAILASRLLEMYIRELMTLGVPIRLDCVVGNHPRMTVKFPTKAAAYSSYDWVVYETLADKFINDPQVKVNIHTGHIGLVRRFNWNYVLEHGVDVKNGREEDYEDRVRALFDDPTYRKATGFKGASFDQILIGNLHKSKFLERTVVNGCLTGQNELGQAWRLKPIKAIQQLFGISKGHVRTWEYSVDVTSVGSEKAENDFSRYTKQFLKRHGRNLN